MSDDDARKKWDEARPEWYAHDGRPPAPPPVKVSASLLAITVAFGIAYALALLFTKAELGVPGRVVAVSVIVVIALALATLAYQLLRGNPVARIIAIALTVVGIVLQVMWFQTWFCWTILFSLVLIGGLVMPDSNRFFSGLPPENEDFSRPIGS
ncbi:MAG: hypothetical protein ACRDT4_26055 [Micromonosporaceae bacterium]